MSLSPSFPPFLFLFQFFIRDTKSSNGTFVNECRLSPSGEESSPTEMRTRDIVQFGVNVNVEKKGMEGWGCEGVINRIATFVFSFGSKFL